MRSAAALDEVSPRFPSPVGRMAQLQLRTANSAVDVHGVASPFVIGTSAMQAMDDSPEAHAHIVGQVMSHLKVGLRTLNNSSMRTGSLRWHEGSWRVKRLSKRRL